eukprot:12310462-Alexandrium_andersonii.AAC.1
MDRPGVKHAGQHTAGLGPSRGGPRADGRAPHTVDVPNLAVPTERQELLRHVTAGGLGKDDCESHLRLL